MESKEDYAVRKSDAAAVAGFEHLSRMIYERMCYEALDLADRLVWMVSNNIYECVVWDRKLVDFEQKMVRDLCDKLNRNIGESSGKAVDSLIKWAEKTMEECDGTE